MVRVLDTAAQGNPGNDTPAHFWRIGGCRRGSTCSISTLGQVLHYGPVTVTGGAGTARVSDKWCTPIYAFCDGTSCGLPHCKFGASATTTIAIVETFLTVSWGEVFDLRSFPSE